jgi:PAS domain S-box-containing protein
MDEIGRITESLMRDALLGAGAAVWEWEVRSDRLSNTDASAALLGYGPGEIGMSQPDWDALIHPDDLAGNDAEYLRHARGATPIYEHEYRALAKDGAWRWLVERGQVIERAPDGEPLRMVGTLSDITLRREAEGAALEMAERLRKISRHVPGMVYQYRSRPGDLQNGYFPYISDSVIDLLGVDPQVLVRDASAFFRMVEREDRERVLESIVESGRTMKPWRCEFRIHRRGAPPLWLSGAASPQREVDQVVLWHGYMQDVTDQHDLEQARAAAAAAQASNRAKTEFLSRMSHELRTPLNAVLGFAQLLELDAAAPLTDTQRRRVELIREAGAHLLQMIGELLDLTRIESGQLAVSLMPLPLAPLLADCVELVRPQAAAAGVSLQFEVGRVP